MIGHVGSTMSLFDDVKTVSFSTTAWPKRQAEFVRFCEREERMFVLLSDLWRLCHMEGDMAPVVGVYVRAMGRDAAQHFIFKGTPQEDALTSKSVALRMVSDWTKDAEDSIFHEHPIEHMFADAQRAIRGLAIIRDIFERVREGGHPSAGFDAIELMLEVDLTARAMLSNWGRTGSGFPPLDKGQASFLRSLTIKPNDARKAKRFREAALWFFLTQEDRVFDCIQPQTSSLRLKPH